LYSASDLRYRKRYTNFESTLPAGAYGGGEAADDRVRAGAVPELLHGHVDGPAAASLAAMLAS
jgi:hypothetical protein